MATYKRPTSYPKKASKPSAYIPIMVGVGATLNGLANNAQAACLDQALVNPQTSQAYGRGVLKGLRFQARIVSDVVLQGALELLLLILPTGMAVPTVNTVATVKANERFIWLRGLSEAHSPEGVTCVHLWDANPGTKRRYEMNDRLVLVVVNRGGVALGAATGGLVAADVFAEED